MFFLDAAYSHQSAGVKLLLWACSGIPSRHSSTAQHYMPAAVHTFHRRPYLRIVNATEKGFGEFQEELASGTTVLNDFLPL
jgi:hypothetical protein